MIEAPTSPVSNSIKLISVVILLLLQFWIRSHNIQAQEPYVDEGYHVTRASIAWDFSTNLAALSHGKLLTYFWLGLFEGSPTTSLVSSRLAIGLFSLITGAALYLMGRLLSGHLAGIVALATYSLLPLAFMYERMAFADPFAGGLACLVVWRSWVLVRHPTPWQGVTVGILLSLASLAKMTMVGLPLVVVGSTLIFYHWEYGIRSWLQRYLFPLTVVACTVLLLWSPVLVSAYFSPADSDTIILNPETFQRNAVYAPTSVGAYISQVVPLLIEFISSFLAVLIVVSIWGGLVLSRKMDYRRSILFNVIWLLSLSLPIFITARVVTSRYLMPLSMPAAVLVGLCFSQWWNALSHRNLLRVGLIFGSTIWLTSFALPFIRTALSQPLTLNLTGNNQLEFQSGLFLADDRLREAVAWLESADPPGIVYATREACNLMYFYSNSLSLSCLAKDPIPNTGALLMDELQSGEIAYFVESWFYGPFILGIDWLETEEISLQTAPQYADPTYEFRLWKIWLTTSTRSDQRFS